MLLLNDFIAEVKPLLEETLEELIPLVGSPLFEAASYSLEEGKRLRPLLTLAVVSTFDQSLEAALHPTCALELIHTYSLIHDDLPCMDDDDIRRKKPSLHKAYSESTAVLTGDFLLTLAFEVLANAPDITSEQKLKLISCLSQRAGEKGMIGGQVLDIAYQGNFDSLTTLVDTHRKKTGALFKAAFEFGAILCNQPLETFQEMGDHLGLAYQIVDDLLDQDGIISMLGEEKTSEWASTLHEKTLLAIQKLDRPAPILEQLATYLIFRNV